MKTGVITAAAAAAAFAVVPVAAQAAETETITQHRVTEVIQDAVPCVGEGELTLVYNSVEHVTVTQSGVHFTFTQTGTFRAVLDSGGTASGRFTVWGGGSETLRNSTSTFTFSGQVRQGVGAGTRWNSVSHITGSEVDPTVAFDRFRCH